MKMIILAVIFVACAAQPEIAQTEQAVGCTISPGWHSCWDPFAYPGADSICQSSCSSVSYCGQCRWEQGFYYPFSWGWWGDSGKSSCPQTGAPAPGDSGIRWYCVPGDPL